PIIGVNPDSIYIFLHQGGIDSVPLTLTNTGGGTLHFSIRDEEVFPGNALEPQPKPYETEYGLDLDKGEVDRRHGVTPTEGLGGPDNFGHRWIDSDEPNGPTFDWIDISGVGTPVSLGDDDFIEVPLPFTFSFYGVDHTSIKISSNGYLTFGLDATDFSNDPIPDPIEPNDVIAPFWDDLNPAQGGDVYYHSPDPNTFIVQWDEVPHFGSGGPYTFQAILKSDRRILFQYLDMNSPLESATIGIENFDGSDGLEVVYNAPYMHDNLAILISSEAVWVSQHPASGSIPPGGSLDVQVVIDANGFPFGIYRARMLISSNDPVNPEVVVPVTLEVGDLAIGDEGGLPREFGVAPNYPNPFNPSTTITYQLPQAGEVRLVIYNLLGQKVRTLVDARQEAGRYRVVWDGRSDAGAPVASGVYVYRFEVAGKYRKVSKMILLK
ncbi:MAG: T9SS C-terminal target domain-containing protein, partial [Calditrichaeota bacterium]